MGHAGPEHVLAFERRRAARVIEAGHRAGVAEQRADQVAAAEHPRVGVDHHDVIVLGLVELVLDRRDEAGEAVDQRLLLVAHRPRVVDDEQEVDLATAHLVAVGRHAIGGLLDADVELGNPPPVVGSTMPVLVGAAVSLSLSLLPPLASDVLSVPEFDEPVVVVPFVPFVLFVVGAVVTPTVEPPLDVPPSSLHAGRVNRVARRVQVRRNRVMAASSLYPRPVPPRRLRRRLSR
ncbi:hypothetical protein [Nannocystis pusilla]|uniref:hypothetical protein n=1 Tax=Nannocystis pusilla TaxID=889268 RepID=UPI003B7D3F7C